MSVTSVAPDRIVARARWALMSLFALLGIMMSSWLSRLPSIRDRLEINESQIGIVLLVGAAGSLAMVTVAGPLVTRFGGLRIMTIATGGFVTAFGLLALGVATGSVELLTLGVVCNAASFALNNVPLNVETAAVERRMGRTVIPQFHACFSIGALVGTFVGAGASWANVSVEVQFVASALVLLVWRSIAVPRVVLDTVPAVPAGTERGAGRPDEAPRGRLVAMRRSWRPRLGSALGAWRERRTVLIGFVIMAAAISEGAANDWLSLAVVDGFGQPEAVGALVFGVFVGSMTVLRIAGTRLIDSHGRVTVLRFSGLCAIVGLAVFGLAPNLPLAVVGVALWGFGAALVFPVGIAAVSEDPVKAAGRVSVIAAFSSMANLGAPPLLGLVAHQIGARYALTLIIAVMVVSLAFAGQAAGQPRVAVPDDATFDPDGDGVKSDGAGPDAAGRDGARSDAAGPAPAGSGRAVVDGPDTDIDAAPERPARPVRAASLA